MTGTHIEIEFDKLKKPFNTRLVLDVEGLKALMPLIMEEIMQGRADSQGTQDAVLFLNLDEEKYGKVIEKINVLDVKQRKRA